MYRVLLEESIQICLKNNEDLLETCVDIMQKGENDLVELEDLQFYAEIHNPSTFTECLEKVKKEIQQW